MDFGPARVRGTTLHYASGGSAGTQQRLKNHLVLTPMIDLSNYRIEAVVDRIVLEASLPDPSQFRFVQKALETALGCKLYVKPMGDDPNHCSRYHIWVQDPNAPLIENILRALQAQFGRCTILVTNLLEVSLDFFPLSGTEIDLRLMLAVIERHLLPQAQTINKDSKGRPRSTFGTGKKQTWFLDDVVGGDYLIGHPEGTTYFGSRHGPVSWRLYAKTSDRRRGEYAVELPRVQWRARAEVTLQGATLYELGAVDLDSLLSLRFESLTPYFRFKRTTRPVVPPGLDGVVAAVIGWQAEHRLRVLQAAGVWAVHELDHRLHLARRGRPRPIPRTSGRRARIVPSGHLVAYKELNEHARRALRSLTAAFQRDTFVLPEAAST